MFAKLFQRGDRQIVVIKQDDKEGKPELRFIFNPGIDGLGICQSGLQMRSKKSQGEAFSVATEKVAFEYVDSVVAELRQSFGGESSE